MVGNVTLESDERQIDSDLLAWLNDTLQSTFNRVEQTCSGAAYCQLFDLIHPGCINLQNVKFNAEDEMDILNNYKLLEGAFSQTSINKPLEIEKLMSGNFTETLNLLSWFKVYTTGCKFVGRSYDPVAARNGQILQPFVPKKSGALTPQDLSKYPEQIKEADTETEDDFCSRTTLCFIQKYWPSASASAGSDVKYSRAKQVLGQNYPKDISGSCNQAPYCLYVYHDVELTDGEKAVVVLIGYFDQMAEVIKVGLLDVIQEIDSDLLNSIMETLKKFQIPVANLGAFYSNAPNLTEVIAGLRAQNSATVFLCSLNGIAEQACRNGITAMELSESIQELIKEVHQHFPYLPAFLKEQLSNMNELNVTASLTCDCHLLRKTVQKFVMLWPDLVQYFTSQGGSSNMMHICFLLKDEALRLSFLFLCHALQPLCDFQESLNQDKHVREVLQDACSVVQAYVSSFVTPKAVERFLRRGNSSPKKDTMEHLSREEVNVGQQVTEYLGQKGAGLADSLDHFYKSVFSFYTAVTSSILQSLPVSDTTVRNISVILSPERNLEVTATVVTDLAVQFGVCSRPEDTSLLIDEYLEYLMAERESSLTSQSNQSLDQFWISELRLMERASLFRKMILMLLILPKELRMEKVFAELFESVGVDCLNDSIVVKQLDLSKIKVTAQDEVFTGSSMHKSARLDPLCSKMQDFSLTDVIDLTEDDDVIPMETNASACDLGPEVKKENPVKCSSELILIDDDDDAVIWTKSYNLEKSKKKYRPNKSRQKEMNDSYKDGNTFREGEMVWGYVSGSVRYPGLVQQWIGEKPRESMRRVVWFGSGVISKVRTESLRPFSAFAQCFSRNSFDTVPKYKDAIFHSLQVASVRAEKVFSLKSDSKEDLFRHMLDWALSGFKYSGPDGLKPRSREDECFKIFDWGSLKWTKMDVRETEIDLKKLEKSFCLKKASVCLKKLSDSLDLQNGWLDLKDEDVIQKLPYPIEKLAEKKLTFPHRQPVSRKKYASKNKYQNKGQSSTVDGDQENSRHQMAHEVLVNGKNIEDFCLSCGSACTNIFHPLFEGSLCLKCKNNFTETLYRYDEDGYQSYCTVCCAGQKVVLCGNESCCRSYCFDCVDILVGKGTFDQLKDLEPWICYLCAPDSSSGALRPRHDWSIRVQEFFANNSAMEFEPHRVYPSIPANQRRPIRVLSLFDGIGTGYLVLKELGIKVEIYVASEIDDDSITVSMVNHNGKITYVEDVRRITQKHIEKWGPFDLLIGGSPCNDLSIVNPARKGLFEGTGRLFFDYYRLLNMIKPKEEDPRPFFWLFENVVFMNNRDKADICRFLECNPVLVDALHVSPAHRARYFWGNLPGMNRPIVASQNDKLSLQDCLDAGRFAKFEKVRTITTNSNSLKQGTNVQHFPVSMNGKDDGLWITELEKIFGFPKHYTDVKNMGRNQRQKVLGKSWSVPVIRHLFAPLKDYFACDKSL